MEGGAAWRAAEAGLGAAPRRGLAAHPLRPALPPRAAVKPDLPYPDYTTLTATGWVRAGWGRCLRDAHGRRGAQRSALVPGGARPAGGRAPLPHGGCSPIRPPPSLRPMAVPQGRIDPDPAVLDDPKYLQEVRDCRIAGTPARRAGHWRSQHASAPAARQQRTRPAARAPAPHHSLPSADADGPAAAGHRVRQALPAGPVAEQQQDLRRWVLSGCSGGRSCLGAQQRLHGAGQMQLLQPAAPLARTALHPLWRPTLAPPARPSWHPPSRQPAAVWQHDLHGRLVSAE